MTRLEDIKPITVRCEWNDRLWQLAGNPNRTADEEAEYDATLARLEAENVQPASRCDQGEGAEQ